jgi:hypothetical protein
MFKRAIVVLLVLNCHSAQKNATLPIGSKIPQPPPPLPLDGILYSRDGKSLDRFGHSLGVMNSGETVFVSTSSLTGKSNSVYVYSYKSLNGTGKHWYETGRINPSAPLIEPDSKVITFSEYVLITYPTDSYLAIKSGSLSMYSKGKRNGVYEVAQKLSCVFPDSHFGAAVSVSGVLLAVGAPGEKNIDTIGRTLSHGSVYIYKFYQNRFVITYRAVVMFTTFYFVATSKSVK